MEDWNMANDVVATRFFANGDGTTDGAVIVTNKDGSRITTIGDASGNVHMPNDCIAKRFFANGGDGVDGTVIVSNNDGSRVTTIGDASGNVHMPNDCIATRYFANGRPDVDGVVQISNKDGSRVITLGGADGFGNAHFPNDCIATRFFANDVLLTNADCAEDFDISGTAKIEPGTVMVLDQEGALEPSQHAYDKRVAGVISGAGGFKPGIVLDKQQSRANRMPIALLGKVYCNVDAQYAPIEIGDLLASSPTPGHAMKAADPLKAFGSVIGKALQPMPAGHGLIPVLVALQ
jgi:hypothetical protein